MHFKSSVTTILFDRNPVVHIIHGIFVELLNIC